MRRREFLGVIGAAAAALPVVGRAQQPERMRRIGWMDFVPESDPATPARVSAFREGMEKQGWVLGRNLAIDYRWSIFDMERALATAEELLNLAPDVMFCAGSPATLALQREPEQCRLCSSPSANRSPKASLRAFRVPAVT